MEEVGPIVLRTDSSVPYALLRPPQDDWGIRACDLVSPPRRLWSDGAQAPATVEFSIDVRRLKNGITPAQVLSGGPGQESWSAQSRRSVARLRAFFLICEDKQRRMDAREVDT